MFKRYDRNNQEIASQACQQKPPSTFDSNCMPTQLLLHSMLINLVPGFLQFKFPAAPSTLDSKFPVRRFDFDGRTLSEAGFDLLSSLLTLDPDRRATAEEALNHRWYAQHAPCDMYASYGSALSLSALQRCMSFCWYSQCTAFASLGSCSATWAPLLTPLTQMQATAMLCSACFSCCYVHELYSLPPMLALGAGSCI